MENINSADLHSHSENIFSEASHICHIFNDDSERVKTITKYYLNSFSSRKRLLCIVDSITPHDMKKELQALGIDTSILNDSFITTDNDSTYYRDGSFKPENIFTGVRAFCDQAKGDGFTGGIGVSGDMSWILRNKVDTASVMEYETSVTEFLKTLPCTAVCEYDARKFDGSLIMDILAVHPVMLIRGQVVKNPYFIPPKDFMAHYYARPN